MGRAVKRAARSNLKQERSRNRMSVDPIGPRIKRMWTAAIQYYQPFHQRIEFELAFCLKLRHYLADTYQTLDQRYVKFRGRELASKVRRENADICAAPIYIECLPTDDNPVAAYTAEDSKWALEHDIRDPMKGFETYLERMVLGALAARTWWLIADYDSEAGDFGEILFRNGDPTKMFICPPYQDLWDPRCPWWIEEVQMRVVEAQGMAGWKNADQLVADNPPPNRYASTAMDSDEQGRVWRDPMAAPEAADTPKGAVTILKCWFRKDPDRKITKRLRKEKSTALPASEQYLACVTPDCGYTSGPVAQDPTLMPGAPCPTCSQPMKLITHHVPEESALAHPDGRLVIYAPNCDVTLYDGSWPFKARSFPAMQFKCYDHPRDPIGLSETTMDQHMQIVSNALMRRAYDSVMAAPNMVILPGTKLKDAAGEPFEFTDEPWQFAYFDDPSGMAAQGIQHFQANPVPASTFQMYSLVQQSFRADIGTAEVSGATQGEDIKNVPVGTVKAFVESGSIPTDHKIRRLRRELSIFFGVIHDMQRSTYTMSKWMRLRGADGQMIARRMLGSSLPGVDVLVTAEPEFKAMSQEELQTIDLWITKFGASEAMAELMHIPPTIVRKITAERQQAQAAATPPPAIGGPPPGPPMSPNGGAPAPNGANGMPPQMMAALMARMRGGPLPAGQGAAVQ